MKRSVQIILNALHSYRKDCIPEGDPMYDDQWDQMHSNGSLKTSYHFLLGIRRKINDR